MSEKSLMTFVCTALAVCIGAFAVDIDWLGVVSLPLAVWLSFSWAKGAAMRHEQIRLDEADRWDHLIWRIIPRAHKSDDGQTYTCHYCEGTWTSGHGEDPDIHKASCHYQWWHQMHKEHQFKRQLWRENR